MLRLECFVLSIAVSFLAPSTARALMVSVTAPTTVTIGSSLDVQLRVEGSPELGDFAPASVREFDFDLAYDASILSFSHASFGEFLGTPTLQALVSASAAGGIVDLKEVSLLSSSSLDGLQPQDFLLATVTFHATAPGFAAFELTQRDIGDAAGAPFPVTGQSVADVEIVPESGAVLLLAGAIVSLMTAQWRRSGSLRG